MFAIVLLVTLALPSVIQACCFPDQMSYTAYVAGQKIYYNFLVDHKEGKIFSTQSDDSAVQYTLFDLKNNLHYIRLSDKSCIYGEIAKSKNALDQSCIPETAKSMGVHRLGSGLEVETFVMTNGGATSILTVTLNDCLPVFLTNMLDDEHTSQFLPKVHTIIYANITTTGLDFHDLHQNQSDCKHY